MAIFMKLATCHVRNAFKRPLRPNAPTVRVLTIVILKGIGWAFRKLYPTKIPGMVHQGLLAPQRLVVHNNNLYISEDIVLKHTSTKLDLIIRKNEVNRKQA